jgi:hypothetical protein
MDGGGLAMFRKALMPMPDRAGPDGRIILGTKKVPALFDAWQIQALLDLYQAALD